MKDDFSYIFKEEGSMCLQDQLRVLKLFPTYFSPVEAEEVGREITLVEVEYVLKGFARDKSPEPNGWPVEL